MRGVSYFLAGWFATKRIGKVPRNGCKSTVSRLVKRWMLRPMLRSMLELQLQMQFLKRFQNLTSLKFISITPERKDAEQPLRP
jgi:hypothetical protein